MNANARAGGASLKQDRFGYFEGMLSRSIFCYFFAGNGQLTHNAGFCLSSSDRFFHFSSHVVHYLYPFKPKNTHLKSFKDL